MSCGLMTLTLAGTNELQKMVAEHRVVIGQGDKQFTAEKAEYTGTNSLLELTESPTWRAGAREGKGDWIRVNLAREEMLVHGNAFMKLPATELRQSAVAGQGAPKRSEPKVSSTSEFAKVYSQQYFLTPASALFQGNVRIEHPQMKWACEEITMLSPSELGKDGRMIIAEPAVVFDLADDQGWNLHGTGKKVVYTHRITATLTNDIMELTGNPATLDATRGSTNILGRNNVIIMDLASYKFMAPGKYKFWGTAPDISIPTIRSPKARLTK
jgi:lipopolysaccharide export system protein LptA